jgi:transposase InsO family protein
MTASLAVSALRNAVRLREPTGTIVHSDRASQFRSRKFLNTLHRNGGDNAAMESFFALLQKNVLDRQRRQTREELRLAIVTWIERTYHPRHRQARLGKLTPIEFETINRHATAA